MKLIGSYYVLSALPVWATAFLLYIVTIGAIFVLRDRCEGLFYNTSYSAMLGDGALVVVVLMAAQILQRGGLPPDWSPTWRYHVMAGAAGIALGLIWLYLDNPKQWGDRYHHMVVAPLLLYLAITLLPVIWRAGTRVEKWSTLSLILLWAVLVGYDAATKRLNQRVYLFEEQGIYLKG